MMSNLHSTNNRLRPKGALNNWTGVSMRPRSRTRRISINFSIAVGQDLITKVVGNNTVVLERDNIYKSMVSPVSRCEGLEGMDGIFLLLGVKANGMYPVILYENWKEVLKRWEIIGRRVLIEKTGFYV